MAQFGLNETDRCDYDGACTFYLVRRTAYEFYSTGEVDGGIRARLALVNGWMPDHWVPLRWAKDVPDVWSRVGPWISPILQHLHANEPLALDGHWENWVEVGEAVFFREPEYVVHDYLKSGPRYVYRLELAGNGVRYPGNAEVTNGFYAKLVIDERGNRRIVGTWDEEIGPR